MPSDNKQFRLLYKSAVYNFERRMNYMKAIIDRDGCIGCGLCAGTCPEVFSMADDGLAEVTGDVTSDTEEAAQEAADGCPVSVITVE